MSCHAVINSLSQTLFKVTQTCLLDEAAARMTFMQNDLSCFIMELSGEWGSPSGEGHFSEDLFLLCVRTALFFLLVKKKNQFTRPLFVCLFVFRRLMAFSAAIIATTLWLKCFNFSPTIVGFSRRISHTQPAVNGVNGLRSSAASSFYFNLN